MPGYTVVAVVSPAGVVWLEEREIDTGKTMRRFRAPDDQQPSQIRAEREMEDEYDDWQRWRTTREEAERRGLASSLITALARREDAAWHDYLAAIQEWRTSL